MPKKKRPRVGSVAGARALDMRGIGTTCAGDTSTNGMREHESADGSKSVPQATPVAVTGDFGTTDDDGKHKGSESMGSKLTKAVQGLPEQLLTLLANAPQDLVPRTTGMYYDREIKFVSWDFNDLGLETLELTQVTDMQFGHRFCKVDRVKEYRDWILSEPNRFMLWTGDNIDATNIFSPGSPWENIGDAQSQAYKFVEIWAPARHRILGYVGGNHERRGTRTFGDLGLLLATLLQVPYSSGKQFINIKYGEHNPYTITLWHGVGGARTKGTVAQILHRYMKDGDSHLYLMGHVHQPMIMPLWKQKRDNRNNRIVLQKTFGAIGSSFLETWGTYGEVSGYEAHDVLMPRIILTQDGGSELTLK